MSEVTVGTVEALKAALKSAVGGDTILLQPGVYSGVSIKSLVVDGTVTIASSDPGNRAVVTDLNVFASSGFAFSNLEFASTGQGAFAYLVQSSKHISFSGLSVHGSLNGNPQDDPSGISILKSSNIVIENSEFQQLRRGVGVGGSDDVVISGNSFHDLQTDGVMASEVTNIHIVQNSFRNFFPVAGDHPDGIQFLTKSTTTSSENIVITGNVMSRGDGAGFQGIFMRDEEDTLAYKNVTISDNLLIGTGYNGIMVGHSENLQLLGNQLISYEGKTNQNWILIRNSDGVIAQDNEAIKIAFDEVKNLVDVGNTLNLAVDDDGQAAIAGWANHGQTAVPGFPIWPTNYGYGLNEGYLPDYGSWAIY